MNSYINSLTAVMIVCQISVLLAPSSEYAIRYIRMVCALIVLLTILAPLKNFSAITVQVSEAVSSLADSYILSADYNELEGSTAGLMQYITEYYGISELTAVLLTDDTDTTVTELQLYIQDCPYTTRELIEEDLNKELNFPVYVFSE